MPTVAYRSASSYALTVGCQRLHPGERELAFGGGDARVAHRQAPSHVRTNKCEVNFFYGHSTIFLDHLGHGTNSESFPRAIKHG